MKLRTSFFNSTVLKKDITRFAPVWGLYSVFLLLLFIGFSGNRAYSAARNLEDLCSGAGVMQMIYGVICAAMLFGDLFQSRMCNALHGMPLRREGWCLSHLAAGLLFFLVPTGLFSLLMLSQLGQYWYISFIFLGISFLCFLFFFATGALCALLAGNRLGMLVLFSIFHFFSVFVYSLLGVFYEPFLYGVPLDSWAVFHYSPIMMLSGCEFLELSEHVGIRQIYWEELRYLAITGLVGLICSWLTVLLYRRRKLEAAGDFLAFPWVKPVFLGVYCLSVGMLLYLLGDGFDTGVDVVFLLVGLAVGFFTGRMLLQRRVRVFQPKAFAAFLLILAVLGVSVGIVAWDLLGIVRRVPETQQIAQVEIRSNYDSFACVLEGEEDLETVVAIHQNCLVEREVQYGEATTVHLTYRLKNGGSFTRFYPVHVNSSYGAYLKEKLSSWQLIFGTDDWEGVKNNVEKIMYEGEFVPARFHGDLLEAIRKDCEAGNMAQDPRFYPESDNWTWIELTLISENGKREFLSLRIVDNASYTFAFLVENQLQPEVFKYS